MIVNEMTVSVPLEVVKASEIEPKEVKWLWYPYIPFGKVTLLQGDPGDGKSKLMLSIAALLSRGEPLPFTDTDETEPMTIIYGVDLVTTANELGHANATTTAAIYAHQISIAKAKAANVRAGVFAGRNGKLKKKRA